MNPTPLRVLCLEDDPRDAELLRERLSKSGFDLVWHVAASRKEYSELLEQRDFELIIADYTLPDFNALGALDLAIAAGVEAPFICVSGTVSEEQAVALLERGAADYLLKDSLGRLSFSVRRALEYAREAVELRTSQERFKQLFDHLSDPVVLHDNRIVIANPAAHAHFGFPPRMSMTGMDIDSLVHPDSIAGMHASFDLLRSGLEITGPYKLTMVRADGSTWIAEACTSRLVADDRLVFESTFHDLTEQRRKESELGAYREELESLISAREGALKNTQSTLASVTAVLSRTTEVRDPYTAGHQLRVAALSAEIARGLRMSSEEVEAISIAAAIHDIGKVAIPSEILTKPEALSRLEYELVKTHAQTGYDIISCAQVDEVVSEIVYQHHERCDGSGYPRGLRADQILVGSKIVMVADVVEAMSTHRPYRPALAIGVARDEIRAGAGVKFDAEVVDACISLLDDGFEFPEA